MAPTIEVRTRFTPDDEAITHLHRQAFAAETTGVEPWGDRLRQHSATWAGAFIGEELLAFVHVVRDGGIHGFLLDTVVRPDHQRKGLGKAVVAAAVEEGRPSGAPGCTSTTNHTLRRSIEMLAASGAHRLAYFTWADSNR